MKTQVRRAAKIGVVLSVMLFLLSGSALPVSATVTSVTLDSPGTYGEDDDYFTTVWGNPRDMDDPHDLYALHDSCGSTSMWNNPSYSNGIWSATTKSGTGRYLWVLNPGWASTLNTQEDGQLRKVNTSYYTQLTFRMRVQSGAVSGLNWILWADGPIATPQRGAQSLQVQDDGAWHIYTFDLSGVTTWTSAPISSLWIQLNDLNIGRLVEVDWIRLTPKQIYGITWSGSGLSGTAGIYVGSNLGDPEQQSHLVVSVPASAGSYDIPASFPGGTYYVRVGDSGGSADSSSAWVFKPVPIAQIVAPSYTSGQDFATTVVGNPWDMAGVDDVNAGWTENESYAALGGILDITNHDDGIAACAAPWPHRPLALNLGGYTVDTAKYKYLSYRYKVDQAPDQGDGGVMRVRWLDNVKWWAGRTDDISLYNDGWNTYKLDLSSVTLEFEQSGWTGNPWPIFQLMVNESHDAWTSHLDWVKLTAENQTSGAYLAGWNIVQGDVLTTTAYWDADQNPGGLIGGYEVPTQTTTPTPPGPLFVYLPLVTQNYGAGASELVAEKTYSMNSAGLTNGQSYYFVLKLEDGYNTVYWYSELPVKKNP